MNMNIRNNHIFELRVKLELCEDKKKQSKRRNLKRCRLERKSNPWPLRYRCSALTNWAIKPTGSWSIWVRLFIHCDDLHIILSLSAVQIYDYFIYSHSFLHLRDKYEPTIDQLPVSLIAQLVRALHRYRRGHGFDSRSSLNFFRFLLFNCLSWNTFTARIFI